MNPVTNKIYVANNGSGGVSVIDGATNTTTSPGVGTFPSAVVVNPVTNNVYVANTNGNSVSVINGGTVTPVNVGSTPKALAVNPITNKVYVADQGLPTDSGEPRGASCLFDSTVTTAHRGRLFHRGRLHCEGCYHADNSELAGLDRHADHRNLRTQTGVSGKLTE